MNATNQRPLAEYGRVEIDGIDKPVSPLALGTAFYKLADKDTWFGVLDRFVAAGGTLIDTARCYGQSEDVMGLWLASRDVRNQIILITKGGVGDNLGLSQEDFAPTIERELAQSLQLLGIDQVDLYMLHRDSPTVPVGAIMECLNRLREQGRVNALGASNWEYDRIAEANDYARKHGLVGFSSISNNISLAKPAAPFYPGLVSVDTDGERWHQQTGTPLVVWSAQARGFFTGRYAPAMRESKDEIRDGFTARMLEVYGTDGNFERLRRAAQLGESKGDYSATQVALAWLLHKHFPLAPLVGAHTEAELDSCIHALTIRLSPAETAWLDLKPWAP